MTTEELALKQATDNLREAMRVANTKKELCDQQYAYYEKLCADYADAQDERNSATLVFNLALTATL